LFKLEILPNDAYLGLGLPSNMLPTSGTSNQISRELGLVFHADSGILRGIRSVTNASTRANIDGAVFCAISSDDTSNNPHNPMYWFYKSGAEGSLVQLAGTRNSTSGGRSRAPATSVDLGVRPVTVNNPDDVLGLVSVGRLTQFSNETKARRVLDAIKNLSLRQIQQFSNKSLPQQVKELVNCGYIQVDEKINSFSPSNLDPRLDPIISSVFSDQNNSEVRKVGVLTKLLLDQLVGAGTVTLNGYDYHTGNRSTGELRDFAAGEQIGRAFEAAAQKNQNLVIYVFTDGGVYSRGNIDSSVNGRDKPVWNGDGGDRSASFILVYGKNGRPALRKPNKRQVGWFNMAVQILFMLFLVTVLLPKFSPSNKSLNRSRSSSISSWN